MISTLTALLLSCALRPMAPQEPQDPRPQDPLPAAARAALGTDATAAEQAIAKLRAAGPAGLDAFLAANPALAAATSAAEGPLTPEQERFSQALDRIGAQRDDRFAKLYWFTDLEAAKAEALRTGRPILSLHLLGRLDEELSCANSRFFRTALYSNAQVGALLRDHFVLHWQSVRPAPRITVDYGDGRKLETTITGNSIHYVLAADGEIVDALPGLYGPASFASELADAEAFLRRRAVMHTAVPMSSHWHLAALRAGEARGITAMSALAVSVPVPDAGLAALRAMSKMGAERPLLRRAFAVGVPEPRSMPPAPGDTLDATSRCLFAAKCAPEVRGDPDRLGAAIARFEERMAADTAQNQSLRASILGRLLAGPIDLPALDHWVYSSLFLTPDDDPWLGLLQPDDYTGVENGGIRR
jgi:hypothetical protein